MNTTKPVLALIVAGGLGSRLHELTSSRPKPNVPIEKRRLIDFVISNCLNSHLVQAIEVVAHAKGNKILRHVEDAYVYNRVAKQVRCQFSEDQNFRGSADAIRKLQFLFDQGYEHFLVLSADHLYVMDYNDLIQQHVNSDSAVTVVTARMDVPDSPGGCRFGVINVDENMNPWGFDEKPSRPQVIPGTNQYLGSLGIYMFNVVELKKMLEECVGNDFGGDIIPHAFTSGRKVSVFEFDDYWIDAGTISDLYQANMDLLGPAPRINLYDHSKPIMHRPRHLPSPKFVNGSQVQDSIVGDGSIITGSVMSSVLSSCVWVDENALVDRCVIFDDVKIGIGAKITKAIIDKHCRIEAGVVLGQNLDLDKTLYPEISIRDGIIVVPKNTTLKKVD